MNPYVIDKQKQVAIYILFAIGVIFSFVLGFVFGFQLASTGSIAGVLSQQSVPAIEQIDNKVDELSDADNSDSGELVDPVTAKTSGTNQTKSTTAKTQQVVVKPSSIKETTRQTQTTTATKIPPKPVSQPKPQVSIQQPKSAIKPPVPKPVVKPEVTKPVVKQPVEPEVTQADNSTASVTPDNQKAQYSVQAGLFASRDNAVKFLDELLSNGFDAYLQDFVSTSGAVKYNVRFGRSEDRDLVQKRLEEFQQAFTTPAYIVIDN